MCRGRWISGVLNWGKGGRGKERGRLRGLALTEYFEALTRAADDLMEWFSNVEGSELLLALGLADALIGLGDVEVGLLGDCRKFQIVQYALTLLTIRNRTAQRGITHHIHCNHPGL